MTTQGFGVLLVVVSAAMACLVSLSLDRRHPRRAALRHAKPGLSRRRRFAPLHY